MSVPGKSKSPLCSDPATVLSNKSTVGITVPKLLPITGTFAPAFALYHCLLAIRVSLARNETKTGFGLTSKDTPLSPSSSTSAASDPVQLTARCHGNYVENVPFALLLGAIVEMNGGNRRVLTGSLGALLLARIAHVEFGLKQAKTRGLGRPLGHVATLAFISGMGGYAAWLVKGYWGL